MGRLVQNASGQRWAVQDRENRHFVGVDDIGGNVGRAGNDEFARARDSSATGHV